MFGQENNIDQSVWDKFETADLSMVQTMQELTKDIAQLTADKTEQLQMLLLWTHKNMYADSTRFFQNGNPLTTGESLTKRIGLCDEYSNILSDFCKIMKIPSIRIEGYVKYLNFRPGDRFEETNHAWNAVFIDSAWMLCDLFWSTNTLRTSHFSAPHFVRRINTKYFLSPPNNFIINHLPCDPIFQFDNYPISINAFTALEDSISLTMERMPYCNYIDSINQLMALNEDDRIIRTAQHAYAYNMDNPNILIAAYYNYGVLIINNKESTKAELKKIKNYFTAALILMDLSNKEDIKALKDSIQQGLGIIDKRLKAS